jgi:hypothetical protein
MRDAKVPGDGIQALTLAPPARTRSEMSERSNSAIAAITVNMAFPIGEEVSICSVMEMKATPRCRNSSSASMSYFVERAKRSNFQTRTVSTLRVRTGPQPCQGRSVGGGAAHLVDELVGDR